MTMLMFGSAAGSRVRRVDHEMHPARAAMSDARAPMRHVFTADDTLVSNATLLAGRVQGRRAQSWGHDTWIDELTEETKR